MSNVLITGCSSGFGLLTALRFARAGDRVVATMRTPEKAPAALTDPIAKEKLPSRSAGSTCAIRRPSRPR
jgi:NAD(P)-dependent dehydrogenase (short-subunit alcohol dehydrogenase family)